MITNEMLAADAALSGLTDEQRTAIVTMSKNDEEVVIGNRFREVYNQLDATIAKETGIARNGDEKTYLYLERAAKTLAAKANSVDGLNSKINDLTKEREKLQQREQVHGGIREQIQDHGDQHHISAFLFGKGGVIIILTGEKAVDGDGQKISRGQQG